MWIGRYQQFIGMAQQYASQLPVDSIVSTLEQELANVDPKLNFTGVTYGELVSDYNTVYSQFIAWYGQFFGPNGLINLNTTTILDGTTTLFELELETPIGNDVFAIEEPSVNSLMSQFESIAEWVSTKFGGVILQNSCNLCASLNVAPVVNSTNSTNATNATNATSNITIVTNTTNSTTLPIFNGTNATVPVNSTNATNATNITNSTGNTMIPVVFTSSNFTLPENCTFTDLTNQTVSCNDGAQNGTFTLLEVNNFDASNLTTVCAELENVDIACSGVAACFQN
jgi:hypothetical protein